MKSIRELPIRLLQGCGDIDDDVRVKICRRDNNNIVTYIAILPLNRVDINDNICIEESQIKWIVNPSAV